MVKMVLLRKTLKIATLVAATVLASCQFRPDESVDFSDLQGAQNLSFRVIGQHEVDLNEGVPMNCYLPGGTRLVDYIEPQDTVSGPNKAPKTTSTNAAEIM